MKTSEQINEIAAALAKAQGEIRNPEKTRVNPHFKSKYADIADGLDVIRPALSKHGVAFVQATELLEGGDVVLLTTLIHSSGQWLQSSYPVGRFVKHQELGASLTYAKRQALFSLVGVAGDDDDDGNSASASNGNAQGAAPTRRSSASIKKSDPEAWPALEKEVRSAGTRADLDRIWKAHEADIVTWPVAWRAQVDELFISRLDEIEGRSGVGDLEAAE